MNQNRYSGLDFGSNYRVNERIGAGSSGVVYSGVHKITGETVAIKFLREEYHEDSEVVHRFITERNHLISLTHPGIVSVNDLIVDNGRLGIVMEYAKGVSLRSYLDKNSSIAPKFALTILKEIVEALKYAHQKQVVHRDIKPDNIILTNPENKRKPGVKIADFGIASIVNSSHKSSTSMVGTPAYMAPELIEHATISPSVDFYACGITLYEMLTATTPFAEAGGSNPFAMANQHLHATPPEIPNLEEHANKLLKILLSKNLKDRENAQVILDLIVDSIIYDNSQESLGSANELVLHQAIVIKTEPTIIKRRAEDKNIDPNPGLLYPSKTGFLPLSDLPESTTATVLKPKEIIKQPIVKDSKKEAAVRQTKTNNLRKNQLGKLIISVITIFAIVAIICIWRIAPNMKKSQNAFSPVEASLEDQIFPSGLRITRSAIWDPEYNKIDYSITYSSIKSPLSGQVMESLIDPNNNCVEPSWIEDQEISIKRHSSALTSLQATCSWAFEFEEISPNKSVTIKGSFRLSKTPVTKKDLQELLEHINGATRHNLMDSETTSTAYPLQRLIGMRMISPARIPQGRPVPISIIGVWPAGENTITPIYITPSNGEPTRTLRDITGRDSNNLRLTDRCSGAVSVTPNGHDMATLFPGSCTISAVIGNYELPQTPIVITSSGS